MTLTNNRSGFTILELLIAIGITTALTTVLLTVSLTFYGDALRSHKTSELAIESHYALRHMVEDIRLADSIGITSALDDQYTPPGGWQTGSDQQVLVINTPAITSERDIIYHPETGRPYTNELIYFVQDGALYKRILKNELAPNNNANTTCPQEHADESCFADINYSKNLDSLSFTFFDATNGETADPDLAHSVKIDLSVAEQSFGQQVSFENSIRTTLRNK